MGINRVARSCFHSGISFTGDMASLYWNSFLVHNAFTGGLIQNKDDILPTVEIR